MEAGRALGSYCASLHAGTREKERAIAPWISRGLDGEIVDIGMGTGSLARRLALGFPNLRVIGVDGAPEMLAAAHRAAPRVSNLELRAGFAREPHSPRAAAVVFCSVLHEVYSYGGGSLSSVASALRAAFESLLPGGRVIVRDFVRPCDAQRKVILHHRLADVFPGHDFCTFSNEFPYPIALERMWTGPLEMRYETNLGSAYEFITRKNFHQMWKRELCERYGFWDELDAQAMLRDAGFQIVHTEPLHDQWVLRSWLEGKILLVDAQTRTPIPFPPRHLLVIGQKP
jgi:SAM-dependent methyltransferase